MPLNTSQLLTLDQKRHQRKLESRLRQQVREEFAEWRKKKEKETTEQLGTLPRHIRKRVRKEIESRAADRCRSGTADRRDLLDFFLSSIPQTIQKLEEMKVANRDFRQTFSLAISENERKRLILHYAADLGASRAELASDRKAVGRWLGEAAMNERFRRRQGNTEQELEYKVKKLGSLVAHTIEFLDPDPESVVGFWKRIQINSLVREVLAYVGDVRIRRAMLHSLTRAISAMPAVIAQGILDEDIARTVQEMASERNADVWLQAEALELVSLGPAETAEAILRDRIASRDAGDDIFVRRRAVAILARGMPDRPHLADLLQVVAEDPSAFVRQQMPAAVWKAPARVAEYWMHHLLLDDAEPKVRAATLHWLLHAPRRSQLDEGILWLLDLVLQQEKDEFVLRVALHVSGELLELWQIGKADNAEEDAAKRTVEDIYARGLLPTIRGIQHTAESTPVRRWAGLAAERIWCELDPDARRLREKIRPIVQSIPVGKSKRIPGHMLAEHELSTIGRVFCVLTQNDYGLDLQRGLLGYRVRRGPVFATRMWRILYEVLRPATDKRQAFRHTIGRISSGTIRAPSAVLAEISETKVPGEPLFLPDEGSWRPYLPLVDDVLSVLDISGWRARTVRFFTTQGVTEVTAPRRLSDRLTAAMRLTLSFFKYAELRNWRSGDDRKPKEYVAALRRLKFDIQFHEYRDRWTGPDPKADESVTRFFSCLLALSFPQVADAFQRQLLRFSQYFTSVFENSVVELVVFTTTLLLLFLGHHWFACRRLRRARRNIALSLGGWGTRGKSGTERLKGALIGSLGYSLVSKTTGCEAMFLYGETFGETREFPLFRPYDKATIWEHHDVLVMAGGLKASVFLWECMALNPTYVEVLQRQWTRDDLATIVNAYPDHEDIQGPAGWNVASVIAEFAPIDSHVLTTEQQMMPILASASQKVGSSIRQFGWLESGLLTDEIMDRFPYREHPDNVALVVELAGELGVDADFAMKEMADWLIADLGVLRTYPIAMLGHQRLEFTNGCSANERFGCMGNWQRTGFATHDPLAQPDVHISTVVNNRADRVARSRVFASILVNDLAADRHVLIGSNLKGMVGFIWEEWEERMEGFSLWTDNGNSPADRFAVLAKQFRQAATEQHVRDGIAVMLREVADESLLEHWSSADDLRAALEKRKLDPAVIASLLEHQQWLLRSFEEYQSLAAELQQASEHAQPALDKKCAELLKTWFNRKLFVIEDYYATGEQIVEELRRQTPPGYLNRIMGLQNIKGTGLDFVYRWQTWQQCYEACEAVVGADAVAANKGLIFLRGQKEFGQLCQHKVESSLRQLREDPLLRRRQDDVDLNSIQSKLAVSKHSIGNEIESPGQQQKGLKAMLLDLAENFLDLTDSVRRRRRADLIYRELTRERISVEDAITELRAINKRQKGGWLRDSFPTSSVGKKSQNEPSIDSFDQSPKTADADSHEEELVKAD